MSDPVLALRHLLRQRFPDAAPLTQRLARPVATGLAVLDRALPGGGLPRGKLTVWTPRGGAMAVLRAACQATIAAGERAAWIDGALTTGPGWEEGPLLVRPSGRTNALRSAELILRSGGFALVVLAGAEPAGTETVRLARAVREGGGAFVALTRAPAAASVHIASRILPHGYRCVRGPFDDPAAMREATVELQVRALGWNKRVEVVMPVAPYDLRLSLDPGLVDRRGVKR